MDIYLIDQIMKGRYQKGEKILDAGSGGGRNMNWFLANGFDITAIDTNPSCAFLIKKSYPNASFTWKEGELSQLPFTNASFDHLICNAVLHFAKNEKHLEVMFKELIRVLKEGGSLFIRTCMDIGIEQQIKPTGNGRWILPDGSERFLLTTKLLSSLISTYELKLVQPLKTVHVLDKRVMGTIVLER